MTTDFIAPDVTAVKTCRKCLISKSVLDFHLERKNRHTRQAVCKPYRSIQAKERRRTHGDHLRTIERNSQRKHWTRVKRWKAEWVNRNKEAYIRSQRNMYLKRSYGITI